MEVVIELLDFEGSNWFDQLAAGAKKAGLTSDLSLVSAPPGTFGAARKRKAKAKFSTAKELGTILSLIAALYGNTGSQDEHKSPSRPEQKIVIVLNEGTQSVEVEVPCTPALPTESASFNPIADAVKKLPDKLHSIQVRRR